MGYDNQYIKEKMKDLYKKLEFLAPENERNQMQ
jgi:hypothetical protein